MKLFLCIFILLTLCETSIAQPNPKTWFWKITKPGIKTTSYIFGSFHEFGNPYFNGLLLANFTLIKSDIVFAESLDTNRKVKSGLAKTMPVVESD